MFPSIRRTAVLIVLGAGLGLASAEVVQAQPKTPPPPAKYKVKLRYKIDTIGLVHVDQFDEMMAGLKKHGFVLDPKLADDPFLREDRARNQITGLVPGKDGPHLVEVPFVQSVLLVPENFNLPKDPGQRVQIKLELPSGFSTKTQQEFDNQLRGLLYLFGFEETVAYDHHGLTGRPNTRLRGTVPVDQLEILLKDIRKEPSGWFAPLIPPEKLPEPLKLVNPLPVIEVVVDPAPVRPPPIPLGRGEPEFEKISPDLWALVQAGKPHTQDLRVEIILATTPPPGQASLNLLLQKTAPRMQIEGRLGNIVTAVFPAPYGDPVAQSKDDFNQIKALTRLGLVSVVRIPQPALVHVDPAAAFKGDNALALLKSGVADYHKKGFKGKGIKLVVLDSDFRGWQDALDQGQLPKGTLLIDLTRERNPGLVPDPIMGDPKVPGHGTQCAVAAAVAAPEATLLLVRIDPASPLMIKTTLEYVFGEYVLSPSLARRNDELVQQKANLGAFRAEVAEEHKHVLKSFEDDKEMQQKYGFLGAVGAWTLLPREWLFLREAELEKAEQEYIHKQVFLSEYIKQVQLLRGANIISCSLVWNDGYPLGARSELTKWIDDQVRPKYVLTASGKKIIKGQKPLWIQAAGNTRGQSWQALFRDADHNGVMEFADSEAPLPPGSWTPELNFLAWQPYQGASSPNLPGDTKFRLSVQWAEPHDPAYFFGTDAFDWYLKPLADLQVVILRQRDPTGTTYAQDDFEEVARSFMLPQRLDNYPNSSTYELFVEWTTTKPGRYAVRVEKMMPTRWLVVPDKKTNLPGFLQLTDLTPTGIVPLNPPFLLEPKAAVLPVLENHWELKPRLFVAANGGAAMAQGRPIFGDFATGLGDVPVPADGRTLISVGAAAFDGKSEAFSAKGPPSGLSLDAFPSGLAFDRLDVQIAGKNGPAFGTSLSAPFAAGTAAVILSSGTTPAEFLEQIQKQRKK